MKAYRVYKQDHYGFEHDVRYFISQESADMNHDEHVAEAYMDNETADSSDLFHGGPAIQEAVLSLEHTRVTTVHFWDSFTTDDGTENEIYTYEIITDEIEIEENGGDKA